MCSSHLLWIILKRIMTKTVNAKCFLRLKMIIIMIIPIKAALSDKRLCMSGCGTIERAHSPVICMSCCSVWCGENIQQMSYKSDDVCLTPRVWLPVSSGWRYGYDTVLCDTLYMCEQFGVDGKLYVEVIRTSCFMAKHRIGPHHHAHQL